MLENGLVAVVKRDCPTCELVAPVLTELAVTGDLEVISQDDPTFPDGFKNIGDDRTLDRSYKMQIEIVPTVIRFEGGMEADRTYGWDRGEWERVS